MQPEQLISIIIVCKNPGPRLHAALESIWEQTLSPTPQIVVVDGDSIDGTREWLDGRRHRIDALVSEPDDGLYAAMNKGVALALGQWVLFLGSDDRLSAPSSLADAALVLAKTTATVVSGEARFSDGRIYRFAGAGAAIRRNFVHHQATFYRRDVFARHGGFDKSLRIQADYEHNLRLLVAREPFHPVSLRVAECAGGGLSDSGRWANYLEEISVRHRYFSAWRCWLWDLLAIARCVRKKTILSFPNA